MFVSSSQNFDSKVCFTPRYWTKPSNTAIDFQCLDTCEQERIFKRTLFPFAVLIDYCCLKSPFLSISTETQIMFINNGRWRSRRMRWITRERRKKSKLRMNIPIKEIQTWMNVRFNCLFAFSFFSIPSMCLTIATYIPWLWFHSISININE